MTGDALNRYSRTAVWLHWIIAILIITNIGLVELSEDLSREARAPYMDLHKAIGISVLVFSLLRLIWRFGHKPPPLPDGMAGWQRLLASTTHFLFYVLMIGLPLSGWIWMSTYPAPIGFFGLFEIPLWPVEGQKALQEILHEGHEIGGRIMFLLIILHVAAAFYHQFLLRDKLLNRMLRF